MRRPSSASRGVPRRTTRIAIALCRYASRAVTPIICTVGGAKAHALFFPSAGHQQQDADAERADAEPHWHVHCLFFLYRKFDRSNLGLRSFAREAELLVGKTDDTGNDQNDCKNSDATHVPLLF